MKEEGERRKIEAERRRKEEEERRRAEEAFLQIRKERRIRIEKVLVELDKEFQDCGVWLPAIGFFVFLIAIGLGIYIGGFFINGGWLWGIVGAIVGGIMGSIVCVIMVELEEKHKKRYFQNKLFPRIEYLMTKENVPPLVIVSYSGGICKRSSLHGFLKMKFEVFIELAEIPGRSYYMGKYTVTQKEWKAVMGTTPWEGKKHVREGDDYPATYISWNDCQDFVKKLNAKEKVNKYRLPTEAEWEHACRAGSTTDYCFGDDKGRLGEYAWYKDNADKVGEEYAHRVGQKKPNAWGLYDMHGNVWEWCQDKYDSSGSNRVVRGGSWSNNAVYCRSAYRGSNYPDGGNGYIGLRLLREA